MPGSHDLNASHYHLGNLHFQLNWKIDKQNRNGIVQDAFNYATVENQHHFLRDTKYPHPPEKVKPLLDPRTDTVYLDIPGQSIIKMNAKVFVCGHLGYVPSCVWLLANGPQ